ncbi:MAG: hypothetical protein QXU54_02960 [Candidatus Micrarchaeia archaeon]
MEKQNQVAALKSLSSMVVSLISVVGIVFTVLVYFIVSPSLGSMQESAGGIFQSIVDIGESTNQNSQQQLACAQSQLLVIERVEKSVAGTKRALNASRASLQRVQATTGSDFSSEIVRIKASEDELEELEVQLEAQKQQLQKSIESYQSAGEISTTKIAKLAHEFNIALASLQTLLTGLTVVMVLVFIVLIIISAEELLS